MIPCPLCLLGFEEPHSRDDWMRLSHDHEMQQLLEDCLEARELSEEELEDGICG